MGILSGLISTATNAVGANETAQADAAKSNMAAALQRAQMARQQQQDQIQQQVQAREAQSQTILDKLHQAQLTDTDAQRALRERQAAQPAPPHYLPPVIGPDGQVQLINTDDPTHPVTVPGIQGKAQRDPVAPVAHFTIQNVTGADGKVHLARVNSLTGAVEELPNLGKQPTEKAVSPTAQMAHDHYGRAKAASDALDTFGGTVAANGQISNFIMGHNPIDADVQNANQAAEEFATLIAPILNKGRTTKVELDAIKHTYVPLASDRPDVIAQKSKARAALLTQYAPALHAPPSAPVGAATSGGLFDDIQ